MPSPVGVEPTFWRVDPWWIAVLEGAGAWVWMPGGSPVWVDGAETAEEAVVLVEASRRAPTATPTRLSARSGEHPSRAITDSKVSDAWAQGLRRDVDIARETGLSEAAVWASKRRQGLAGAVKRRWTDEDLRQVLSYPTAREAAEAMGIDPEAAKSARKRARARGL